MYLLTIIERTPDNWWEYSYCKLFKAKKIAKTKAFELSHDWGFPYSKERARFFYDMGFADYHSVGRLIKVNFRDQIDLMHMNYTNREVENDY